MELIFTAFLFFVCIDLLILLALGLSKIIDTFINFWSSDE